MITNQSGSVLVIVALMLVVIMAMAAFAIDIGHLLVVRNELKNAADAGALAGATNLYTYGTGSPSTINVNPASTYIASAATTTNKSDGFAVEAPTADIQRGHWSFLNKQFTPNDTLATYSLDDLTGMSFEDLDNDTDFINAVRVVASRGLDPDKRVAPFFGKLFNPNGFTVNGEAVAWMGFSGSFHSDQPLAICKESVYDPVTKKLNCDVGKLISTNVENAMWTDLTQGDAMVSSNASNVGSLVCNPDNISGYPVYTGLPMSTVNGEIQSVFDSFYNCWAPDLNHDGKPDLPVKPWSMTLPLIECNGPTSSPTSNPVVGALNVEIFWMVENAHTSGANAYDEVPATYADPAYTCTAAKGDIAGRIACWTRYLNAVGIRDASGNVLTDATSAPMYTQKTIFFKPSCELADPEGGPGGTPSNVLAKSARLVE